LQNCKNGVFLIPDPIVARPPVGEVVAMAWDFCADQDFQITLDWVQRFVDDELRPIEPLLPQLSPQQAKSLFGPAQGASARARLVGRASAEGHGRQWLRPAAAGADESPPPSRSEYQSFKQDRGLSQLVINRLKVTY